MKVYEEQSGDRVSENIKLADLQKYLCDGELARHLNLQSGRLTTYDQGRDQLPQSKTDRGRRLDARIPWTFRRSARTKAARRAWTKVTTVRKI